ncbi:GBF-interacting protein 1-like [Lactuca sativa]|uniref:GBF-interacting protein 1 N-terminal domain-containing protein n=1 Tax=Lactuca sativa TaxID=4236 RepID=A0A9R1V0D7_LACSA|nr:GBF-interacting protein 1-like [Lactuca sativa]KAJ0196574.1 hypothetical protein LSAT_V11C700380740 [Lactuca sativa]
MSGGRVTIPNNVRKTIQNIKEITGNHSEDEIYAMLKECSMDPNETAQKLLLQDPFHEVKRKRDRKKENPSKESTEPRWKPGMQGRGNRGGRGNYSSRHMSNDAGGGRTALSAKENGIINKGAEEGANQSIPQGQKSKETSVESDKKQSEVTSSASSSKMEGQVPKVVPVESSKIPAVALGSSESGHVPIMLTSKNTSASKTPSVSPSPSPGVYLSEKDPILMPSQDSRLSVGTIRREVGSKVAAVEQIQETPLVIKSTASGSEQGKVGPGELQGVGKNVVPESSSRPGSSSHVSFPISRPSSNYNNRMQQAIGPQKVGPSMEWKPKPIGQSQGSIKVPVAVVPVEAHTPTTVSSASSTNLDSKEDELEKKLKESHISDDKQHVIIPNHLHVPEAEKLGFCFGSFDATFGFNKTSSNSNGPVSDKTSDETIEEEQMQSRNESADGEEDHLERPPTTSSSNVPESLPDMSSNAGPEYREPKQETSSSSSSLPTPSHQYPVVHTSPNPNFSFGFMPPMIGSQVTSFENTESQARDASHVPSFVVQQPFDPASYYAHFYRESDGRMSPFHSTTKYNGNVPQPSHSSQEVGNSLMLSTTSPTPTAATQTMQSSISVTQQPLPVFRQPPGVHLPHYPPNYIPYGPYFSPFYVPPPAAIHQFLSNGTFPQQPQQGGGMYPAPPPVAASNSKYPLPQYKPGSNNSGHIGSYGPYASPPPAGYNPGSAAANSTSNEDLGGSHSQFKETNVYITGQQSEGPGVWIAGPGPGRDMSGSFYNLPQGGQVAYTTPTQQPNHGHAAAFANIYHPPQPVTTGAVHPLAGGGPGSVDMVGPAAAAASVYQQQQPQPTQINWPNNY